MGEKPNKCCESVLCLCKRWVWSPNTKVLQYEWVQQFRSISDYARYDRFTAGTNFDQNATHFHLRYAYSERTARDDDGKFEIGSRSGDKNMSLWHKAKQLFQCFSVVLSFFFCCYITLLFGLKVLKTVLSCISLLILPWPFLWSKLSHLTMITVNQKHVR